MTAKKRARTRNKKARAAAATAQAVEMERRRKPPPAAATPTANRSQEKRDPLGQIGLQMHQLQADDSPSRKHDIKEDEDNCVHGLIIQYTNEKLKETVMRSWDDLVSADLADIQKVLVGQFSSLELEGHQPLATVLEEKLNNIFLLCDQDISADDVPDDLGIILTLIFTHPEFAEDPIHAEWIVSHFVSKGTQCLLRGDTQAARGNAYFANYFEQNMVLTSEGKMLNVPKLMKLYNADEHTLCSFFRNRIPCSCLDQKYKEVKSLTKMDMCWNFECRQPNRFEIDNKSMMCCSRCRQASYCCSECQEIDWPRHKITCGLARDMNAVFGAHNMDELENNKIWTRTIFAKWVKEDGILDRNVNPLRVMRVNV
jgi:hypothetical protein